LVILIGIDQDTAFTVQFDVGVRTVWADIIALNTECGLTSRS